MRGADGSLPTVLSSTGSAHRKDTVELGFGHEPGADIYIYSGIALLFQELDGSRQKTAGTEPSAPRELDAE